MSVEIAVYSGLVVLLAYWVRGMAGFGSGLIAVPLLTLMWPVTTVVPIVVALDYLGSASQGVKNVDRVA
ncbi:MAG TPA: TSUP family transporter, partial [Candidatus Deferrimicrobiaceae bacterium]|nr:TSUP family transporter [Candidatus Deferrimicrobiaceae bacterium]